MKRVILMSFAGFLLLSGCKTQRPNVIVVESTRDTKTELKDTILNVDVPKEKVESITPIVPPCPEIQPQPSDTSKLETKFARSWAWFDGFNLRHSLENKTEEPVKVPAKVPEKTITIEKPVPYPEYIDRPVDVPVRMPLRWWERFLVYLGGATAAFGGFKLLTWIIKLKKRLPF